jgi:hypothetical protein
MAATKHLHRYSSAAVAHLDELLDDALKATFPASDPVAISFELGVIRTRNDNDDRVFKGLWKPGRSSECRTWVNEQASRAAAHVHGRDHHLARW